MNLDANANYAKQSCTDGLFCNIDRFVYISYGAIWNIFAARGVDGLI